MSGHPITWFVVPKEDKLKLEAYISRFLNAIFDILQCYFCFCILLQNITSWTWMQCSECRLFHSLSGIYTRGRYPSQDCLFLAILTITILPDISSYNCRQHKNEDKLWSLTQTLTTWDTVTVASLPWKCGLPRILMKLPPFSERLAYYIISHQNANIMIRFSLASRSLIRANASRWTMQMDMHSCASWHPACSHGRPRWSYRWSKWQLK